jgi:hypothetical protein
MMRLRFRRTVIEATKVFEAVPLFRLPCMRRRLVPCVPHPCLKWVLACVGTIVAPVGLCTVQASELVVRLQAKSKSKAKHSIHRHAAHRSGQPCAVQGKVTSGRQADRQAGTYVGRILHVGEVESDAFLVAIGIIVVDVQQALRIARAAPARATDRHRQNTHRHICRQRRHTYWLIYYIWLCWAVPSFV